MDTLKQDITLFTFKDVPVRTNWLSLLVLVFFVSNTLSQGMLAFAGAFSALLIIIIGHEFGHALLAKFFGLRVKEIVLTWFGGLCVHEASDDPKEAAIIASGGVLAQAAMLIPALLVSFLMDFGASAFLIHFIHVMVKLNAMILVLNLIPFPGFDGKIIFDYFRNRNVQ